jgi:hypothetical protein
MARSSCRSVASAGGQAQPAAAACPGQSPALAAGTGRHFCPREGARPHRDPHPEGTRRSAKTPPWDIHGTRRSPGAGLSSQGALLIEGDLKAPKVDLDRSQPVEVDLIAIVELNDPCRERPDERQLIVSCARCVADLKGRVDLDLLADRFVRERAVAQDVGKRIDPILTADDGLFSAMG